MDVYDFTENIVRKKLTAGHQACDLTKLRNAVFNSFRNHQGHSLYLTDTEILFVMLEVARRLNMKYLRNECWFVEFDDTLQEWETDINKPHECIEAAYWHVDDLFLSQNS